MGIDDVWTHVVRVDVGMPDEVRRLANMATLRRAGIQVHTRRIEIRRDASQMFKDVKRVSFRTVYYLPLV